MIGLCGLSKLSFLLCHSLTLAYETWQRFPVTDLYLEISDYPTFRSMRDSLCSPAVEAALKLVRSHFAGYLEPVELPEVHENLVRRPNICLFSLRLRHGLSISHVRTIFIQFGNLTPTSMTGLIWSIFHITLISQEFG